MNRGVAMRAWNLLMFCGDNKYFCNMKATDNVRGKVLLQTFCELLYGTFTPTDYTALNGRMGLHHEPERAT
jgi:hypothetical protein